jgi:hypothetical protein
MQFFTERIYIYSNKNNKKKKQKKMNQIIISSNSTFNLSKEAWLRKVGMTAMSDYLIFYILGGVSLVGVLLNLISIVVLRKKRFDTVQLFKYLRVYVLNSLVLCLVSVFNFVHTTHYLFDFTNTYSARAFGAYFYTNVVTLAYFYGGVLDIYLNIERLFCFVPRLNSSINKFSCKKVCLGMFALVLTLNFVQFFINAPNYLDVQLNQTEPYRIWYYGLSSFGKSYAGHVITIVVYVIRDVVTLIAEVVLSSLCVVLLKRHLLKKKGLKLNSLLTANRVDSTSNGTGALKDSLQSSQGSARQSENLASRANKNLTMMVFFMCVCSTLAHLWLISCTTFFLYAQNMFSFGVCYVSSIVLAVKHASNFFLFLFFNSVFMDEVKKILIIW